MSRRVSSHGVGGSSASRVAGVVLIVLGLGTSRVLAESAPLTFELDLVSLAAGPDSPSELYIPFPETIDLASVSGLILDGFEFVVQRQGPGELLAFELAVFLTRDGAPDLGMTNTGDGVIGEGVNSWSFYQRPFVPFVARGVVTGLRLRLNAPAPAAVTLFPIAGSPFRAIFTRGPGFGGATQTKEIGAIPALHQQGAGQAPWQEYLFEQPVAGRDLVYVYPDGLRWLDIWGAYVVQSQLMLSDGSVLALDDTTSPSDAIGSSGTFSDTTALFLRGDDRELVRGLEVIGWRWSIVTVWEQANVSVGSNALQVLFFHDFPDCDGNAIRDEDELTANDCDGDGLLDACEDDCDRDGTPDECAIASGDASDCDANGVPDVCDLAGGAARVDRYEAELPGGQIRAMAAGDLGVDGEQEVVVASEDSVALWRFAAGELHLDEQIDRAGQVREVRVAALTDQKTELKRIIILGDDVEIWGRDDDRRWVQESTVELEGTTTDLEIEDLDSDGLADLVTLDSGESEVGVVWGEQNGFDAARLQMYDAGEERRLRAVAVCDVDADGDGDVVAVDINRDEIVVFRNIGSREFVVLAFPHEDLRSFVESADSDADGLPDTTVVATLGGLVRLTWENGVSVEPLAPELGRSVGSNAVAAGSDIDDDGLVDWAVVQSGIVGMDVVFGDGLIASEPGDSLPSEVVYAGRFQGAPGFASFRVRQPLFELFLISRDPPASADCNGNGVPDSCDIASGFSSDIDADGVPDECADDGPTFRRGDVNDDVVVNIADPVFVLNWLFGEGPEPACLAAANSNGEDDAINISDPTYLLNHLFSGGPAPVAPYPECGTSDLEADEELGCDTPPAHCAQ